MSSSDPITYKAAGVDVEGGNAFVKRIAPWVKRTRRPEVLDHPGGFSGMFDLSGMNFRQPVLVSGTDGVGTKLKIAFALGQHETIGVDLVAMVANDLLVTGAQPLFLLDYYASGRLDAEVGEKVVQGIAEGCRQAGMALLGGETAEMPGMYTEGEYDLAAFGVGIVEKSEIIDPNGLAPGMVLVGLASSGLHSNGFSLVRKVLLERAGLLLDRPAEGMDLPLGEVLLTPTRIYAEVVKAWCEKIRPQAMSHITGGGFPDNIGRLLPDGIGVGLKQTWEIPPIFDLIQKSGYLSMDEMRRTFNMGIGYLGVFKPSQAEEAIRLAEAAGIPAWEIGKVISRDGEASVVWEGE